MVGGRYFGKDISSLTVNSAGRVVEDGAAVIPTETILQLLQSGNNVEVDRLVEEKTPLKLSDKESERNSEIERLRKFVRAEKFETRMVAVTTLGKIRDLNNVPRLLYALTDPDVRVVQEADRGLRFISRKLGGVGLPENEPTTAQIKAAQTAWRDWYLSIRPNAQLLD